MSKREKGSAMKAIYYVPMFLAAFCLGVYNSQGPKQQDSKVLWSENDDLKGITISPIIASIKELCLLKSERSTGVITGTIVLVNNGNKAEQITKVEEKFLVDGKTISTTMINMDNKAGSSIPYFLRSGSYYYNTAGNPYCLLPNRAVEVSVLVSEPKFVGKLASNRCEMEMTIYRHDSPSASMVLPLSGIL